MVVAGAVVVGAGEEAPESHCVSWVVPWVMDWIQAILSVTLATVRGHVTTLTNQSSPGVHPRVAGQRAAPPPADHAYEGVAAVLLSHEGAAGVALAGVLARVRGADVHPKYAGLPKATFHAP